MLKGERLGITKLLLLDDVLGNVAEEVEEPRMVELELSKVLELKLELELEVGLEPDEVADPDED